MAQPACCIGDGELVLGIQPLLGDRVLHQLQARKGPGAAGDSDGPVTKKHTAARGLPCVSKQMLTAARGQSAPKQSSTAAHLCAAVGGSVGHPNLRCVYHQLHGEPDRQHLPSQQHQKYPRACGAGRQSHDHSSLDDAGGQAGRQAGSPSISLHPSTKTPSRCGSVGRSSAMGVVDSLRLLCGK